MQKYDNYKKSSIQWIGETPGHWNYKRFKYCFDLISEKSQTDLPKIGLENIESWTGKYLKTSTEFEGDGEVFEVNDILFGKLRPYLAKVLLASFSGKAVGDIFVFRSKDEIIPGYGHKLILSKPFIEITNSSTFGSKMPRVSWEFISDLEIPIPTKPEQTQIANYLDRKTTEIDNLIADKKALVELYKEEKTAIINQAVTKGINPDAKMKDSGIEWLGEIPEHWEVKKLNWCFKTIGSGTTPKSGEKEYYQNGIFNWLLTGDLNDGEIYNTTKKITDKAIEDYSSLKEYPINSLVIAMYGATIGKLGILKTPTTVNQACCVFSEPTNLNYRFAYYVLLSAREEIINMGYGGGQPNISQALLKQFKVQVPNEREQINIIEFIQNESQEIENRILKAEKYIDLLIEYRTALISEVVTGKIKVTDE